MEYTRISDANIITRQYMDSIYIEERLIGSKVPDLTTEIFGKKFSSPIMMPAFSHLPKYHDREEDGLVEYTRAAKASNILNWVGMMDDDRYESIAAVGADTVRVVKPYADQEKIYRQLRFAKEHGAFAVGMDPDHIFGQNGYDLCMGEMMTAQTKEMIRSYIETTDLPFVIKGVLSVRDAVICAELGVKGIIVSHHHGRLPYALPPMMVLPRIAEAVKGSGMKIFLDCGIESGADVFKALALGADAVAVGRALFPALQEGGTQGMIEYIEKLNKELAYVMGFTGSATPDAIDPSVLWRDGKPMGE